MLIVYFKSQNEHEQGQEILSSQMNMALGSHWASKSHTAIFTISAGQDYWEYPL